MSTRLTGASLGDVLAPAPGQCGRCGGPATFYPREIPRGRKIEIVADLICRCCSFPHCRHPRPQSGQPPG